MAICRGLFWYVLIGSCRRPQLPLDGDLLAGVCIGAPPLMAKGSDWVGCSSDRAEKVCEESTDEPSCLERHVLEEVKSKLEATVPCASQPYTFAKLCIT